MNEPPLRLTLPEGGPQAALMAEIDQRYFRFAERLSGPLQRVARDARTFAGRGAARPFHGLTQTNPILTGVPWLFWEISERLTEEARLGVAEAGAFLGLSVMTLDHLIDGQIEEAGMVTLLSGALHEQGLQRLQQLFPPGSAFWRQYARLTLELRQGLAAEIDMRSPAAQASPARFKLSTDGKTAPAAITVAAIAALGNQPALLAPLESSLKLTMFAGQLHHDAMNWQGDWQSRQLTFFLRAVTAESAAAAERPLPDDFVETAIKRDWRDVHFLRQALDAVRQAQVLVREIPCAAWQRYLDQSSDIMAHNLGQIAGRYVQRAIHTLVR